MATDFGFRATLENEYYFVSYNTEDADRIAKICQELNRRGVPLWYDEGIPHDVFWESTLAAKIDKCVETIFFITKGIFEKGTGKTPDKIFTYKEYDLSRRYEKKKLIVLLDPIKDREVPYSLMSWWQEIDPKVKQGILAYDLSSVEIAERIMKELGINEKKQEIPNEFLTKTGGWGPERPVFSMKRPATYPSINSIMDNPSIGDERSFLRVGEITKEKTDLLYGSLIFKPDKRYLVYIYCHNACSSSFFDEEHNYSGVATGVKISSRFPEIITPEKPGLISATITGTNTEPKAVWNSIYIHSLEEIEIQLERPAKIYNDWKTSKMDLPLDLFSEEGTFVGMDDLDGILFGEESHCIVSYVLLTKRLNAEKDEEQKNKISELANTIKQKYNAR